MARGKAAAQAANRRLTEALERVAALEQQLSEQVAAHRAEVNALRVERDKANSALRRNVDTRTETVIRAAREEAAASVRDARQDCEARIRAGLDWLTTALGDQMPRDLEGCARAFGIQVSDIIKAADRTDGVFNRESRRTSTKSLRAKNSAWRELSQSGPEDAVMLDGGTVIFPEPGLAKSGIKRARRLGGP